MLRPLLRRPRLTLVAILAAPFLAACEGEADPTGLGPDVLDPSIGQIVTTTPINAASNDTLVTFSFSTGGTVPRSGDWDIALRRYEVRLNSAATAGAAAKGVTAYSFGNNRALTNDQILALTTTNTLPAFDTIAARHIPADSAFKGDLLVENRTAYLNLGGAPVANTSAYWKVRTASGGYAAVRVSAIAIDAGNALSSLTLETRAQNGAALGAPQTLTVPFTGAPVSIAVATNSIVTANGCNWDLQINPQSFAITANGGCSAGTFPGGSSPTFANATTANDAPQYGTFLSSISTPIPNSISDTSAPFRYNLLGTSRLHPVFNTYLVKTGTKVYKLQVINYYSEAGTSGWVTLRYARIK